MRDYLCTMECRKRGTSVVPATSKFACCLKCARLQDHRYGSVLSSRLLLRQQRKEYKQIEEPLLPASLEVTHVGSAGSTGRTGHWPGTLQQERATNEGLPGVALAYVVSLRRWQIGQICRFAFLAGRPCEQVLAARVPPAPVCWSVLDVTCWESPR